MMCSPLRKPWRSLMNRAVEETRKKDWINIVFFTLTILTVLARLGHDVTRTPPTPNR